MINETVTILDKTKDTMGQILIKEFNNSWWHGKLIVNQLPKDLESLFLELENLMENQILSLIDETSDRINSFGLAIRKTNSGHIFNLKDIQIYGLDNKETTVCFKLLEQT